MIQLNCTSCQALLTIDDAFAGGVCRCRHCGTIQTVPKHLKDASAQPAAVAAAAPAAPRTLYRNKMSADAGVGSGSGSGLDDLANLVASSGLSSKRLMRGEKANGRPIEVLPPVSRKITGVLVAAGVIIAALLAVIVLMALREKAPDPVANVTPQPAAPATDPNKLEFKLGAPGTTVGGSNNVATAPAPEARKDPNFLGTPISESSVVYVLDRGQASAQEGRLDLLREAAFRSAESLGENRKFQILYWAIGGDVLRSPSDGIHSARAERLGRAREVIEKSLGPSSVRTEAGPAIAMAVKSKPEAIILVAVKVHLSDEFKDEVLKARGDSKVRIHCFSLAQPQLADVLKSIAAETGGQYRDVSMQELRSAAGR